MDKEDEFLHTYFTYITQLCFDKAKEHIDKEPKTTSPQWTAFINFLHQFALSEKSYYEIGFLQNKNKGFLRKDNSLKSIYENMRSEIKKIEENCKPPSQYSRLHNYCQSIAQFLNARINLIEFYEKIYLMGANKQLNYIEISNQIESLIQNHLLDFTDISLISVKAIFTMECEILQHLFKALIELQRLQFLPSLALIHGAHARLIAWEGKIQNRETWKLGLFKNSPLPGLLQWLQKFKGTVLSKFSLYFHDNLAQQTAPSDMRQLCSKLYHDHYQKIVSFQRKYDAAYIILLSDKEVTSEINTMDYDSFPIIVSYPPRSPPQLDTILKMIQDTSTDLSENDKIIYKFSSQAQSTYILSVVESNIYLVVLFENKKSEKDSYIGNFVNDLCSNLRCTKIFLSLKNSGK